MNRATMSKRIFKIIIDERRMSDVERNAYFDNAKVLLIFLVVFGQMIHLLTGESIGIVTFFWWIYTFNMPALIFLAGFLAKASENKQYFLKLAKKLLFPYIIFQILYTFYYFL